METTRKSHAHLDIASRQVKALKIASLLDMGSRDAPMVILEVGTGSGGIANYMASFGGAQNEVHAVDVNDERVITDGYKFQLVSGTSLPYQDGTFDVVISNHVIEHVGQEADQLCHLMEIWRVLKATGIVYLAVPNRWMLVEPHFRLPLLSWMPPSWRSPYVRLCGKGAVYDCKPLQLNELETLADKADFVATNVCVPAIRATLRLEKPDSLVARLVEYLPDGALNLFKRVIPTLIYTLQKRSGAHSCVVK